jgi:hypothetical protein
MNIMNTISSAESTMMFPRRDRDGALRGLFLLPRMPIRTMLMLYLFRQNTRNAGGSDEKTNK